MAKRKKPAVISRKEALRRLKAMIAKLEQDIRIGLWAEAVLVSGNEIFPVGNEVRGGAAYLVVVQALAMNLAISLARLYDTGSRRYPPNKRDLASIPLIICLLRQKRCQKALVDHARRWTPHLFDMADTNARTCEQSITEAIAVYDQLTKSRGGNQLVRRLRNFRNFRLAHTMREELRKSWPRYADLITLIQAARCRSLEASYRRTEYGPKGCPRDFPRDR